MTAERVLKITGKEKEVIESLYDAVCDFTGETASEEFFDSVLRDIVEGLYNEQSVTNEYKIRILKEGD